MKTLSSSNLNLQLAVRLTALALACCAIGVMAQPVASTSAATQAAAKAPAVRYGLIAQDAVALRNAPRDSATLQAQLWQGELVELRGEKLDFMQVWDHKRERGGYVRAHQIRPLSLQAEHAGELLAVLRFVKDAPGSEGLTFGYGAAWLAAAKPEQVQSAMGAQVLDAMGMAAQRLAQRASMPGLSKAAQETISAQLDAAQRYGIRFESMEREGSMRICYDGDLFARLLAMPAASAEHKAHAALALTQSSCDDPLLSVKNPLEQARLEMWRSQTLDRASSQELPTALKNRLHLRRASVWSTVAFDQTRQASSAAKTSAQRALDELGAVEKAELPDDDAAIYNEAVMRVNATRWAALGVSDTAGVPSGMHVLRSAGTQPGQSCVQLKHSDKLLAERCTFGQVWMNSWSMNREGNAGALAVQTLAAWREMWVFRKQSGQWSIEVLVPAASEPELGYTELAGWVQGGEYMLVAREARETRSAERGTDRGATRYTRSYEVIELASLSIKRRASDPSLLAAFQRWQQPQWKQHTVSLR